MTFELRACIYLRSATMNKKAIREQRDACENYARGKRWQVISTHIDIGRSDHRDDRAGFAALWQAIDAGVCDVVVAQDFFRVYRETEKYLIFAEDCRQRGVDLHFLNGLDIGIFDRELISEPIIKTL